MIERIDDGAAEFDTIADAGKRQDLAKNTRFVLDMRIMTGVRPWPFRPGPGRSRAPASGAWHWPASRSRWQDW